MTFFSLLGFLAVCLLGLYLLGLGIALISMVSAGWVNTWLAPLLLGAAGVAVLVFAVHYAPFSIIWRST